MAKISALPMAGPLTGAETVPIVQDGSTRGINPADHLAYIATGAELARDQAADLVQSQNIFVDIDLPTAEASVSEDTIFKLIDSSNGLAEVRRRTAVGSDVLYGEATSAALASPAPGKGRDMIGEPSIATMLTSLAPSRGLGAKWHAGGFVYEEAAPGADDAHLTTNGGTKLYVVPSPSFNVVAFGADPTGVSASRAAIQKAIDAVEAIAVAKNSTVGLPSVVIPGGQYLMDDTALTSRQWISIQAVGNVILDWSGADAATNGVIVNNETSLPEGSGKFPASHAPCVNGVFGTIFILGPGRTVSTGAGLTTGNSFDSFGHDCRDGRIRNVVITGWGVGHKWLKHDTYLWSVEDSRIEVNAIGIQSAAGLAINSGENMRYTNCTIAGSGTGHVEWNGLDFLFARCSFDFSQGYIIKSSGDTSYCSVRFTDCYFEAWDGLVGDFTTCGAEVSVNFQSPVLLPRSNADAAIVNSPSRKLFGGVEKVSFILADWKTRCETRPYLEDGYILDASSNLLRLVDVRGMHFNPYLVPPEPSRIVNRDHDFQLDADGTAIAAMVAWEQHFASNVGKSEIENVSGKKVFQVTINNTAGSLAIKSRNKIACLPGDRFLCNAALRANDISDGHVNVEAYAEFFAADDTSLGVAPSFRSYNFSTALADGTLPNYGDGGDRYMDTTGFVAVAPKNTAYAKMRVAVSGFVGTIEISRARMWRM